MVLSSSSWLPPPTQIPRTAACFLTSLPRSFAFSQAWDTYTQLTDSPGKTEMGYTFPEAGLPGLSLEPSMYHGNPGPSCYLHIQLLLRLIPRLACPL